MHNQSIFGIILVGFALCLMWTQGIASQYQQITIEEGLSHNTIRAIYQDQTGFLWIGTESGLNRYDGYNFVVYEQDPLNPLLCANTITAIHQDQYGELWIGTTEGLIRYRSTDEICYQCDSQDSSSLSHNEILTIYENQLGELWIGTKHGLNQFNRENETFDWYYPDSLVAVHAICEDRKGNLWWGADQGLYQFDRKTKEFNHHLMVNNETSLFDAVCDQKANQLWLTTNDGILYRFDIRTNTYHRINDIPIITTIYQDTTETIWMSTEDGQLLYLHDEDVVPFQYQIGRPIQGDITTLYRDRSNLLWIGTEEDGIYQLNLMPKFDNHTYNPPQSSPQNVTAVAVGSDHQVWIGTKEQGLILYRNGEFLEYRSDPQNENTISGNEITSVWITKAGMVWIGTLGEGLNQLIKTEEGFSFVRFGHDPADTTTISGNTIYTIYEDQDQNLWVGTENGLSKLDAEETEVRFSHYRFGGAVQAVLQDKDGLIWAGTTNGLIRGVTKDNFRHYRRNSRNINSLSSDRVECLHEARDGIIWIGTSDGGLNKFDPRSNRFKRYYQDNQLPNNTVVGILEDENGNLWISTRSGLSRFNPRTRQFNNYDVFDGLGHHNFNPRACFQAGERMFFGTMGGVIAFSPSEIGNNTHPPAVKITQVIIDHQPIAMNDLKTPLVLSSRNRRISFEFTALDYISPQKNQFKYRLDEFDTDWIGGGSNHRAIYTNLDAGHYKFHVIGSNSDDVWNAEGDSLEVIVKPAFWESRWFKILFFITIIVFIYIINHFRLRTIRSLRQQLEHGARERISEVDKQKRMLKEKNDQLVQQRKEIEEQQNRLIKINSDIGNSLRNITILSEIGQKITAELEVEKILRTVYKHMNDLMNARVFGIGIYDAENQQIERMFIEKGERVPNHFISMGEKNWYEVWCIEHRTEIHINDSTTEYTQYLPELPPLTTDERAMSMIYLPMIVEDRVVGVMTVQSFIKNTYTNYHVDMLKTIASYTGVALDNAYAYTKLRQANRELKEAQAQLVQAEKLSSLGQLTAGIAHEINTPIGIGITAISHLEHKTKEVEQLYQSKKIKRSDFAEFLETVSEGSQMVAANLTRAAELIQSFKQVAVDQSTEGKRRFRLKEYIDDVLLNLKPKLKRTNHTIDINCDEKLTLNSFPGVFSQVITNLVMNSLLHAYEDTDQGMITFDVQAKQKRLLFEYRDDGKGIDENTVSHIFDPFFTTKRGQGGTGLGLHIVYNLVTQKLNGTIQCESVIGEGTRFIIEIPMEDKS